MCIEIDVKGKKLTDCDVVDKDGSVGYSGLLAEPSPPPQLTTTFYGRMSEKCRKIVGKCHIKCHNNKISFRSERINDKIIQMVLSFLSTQRD